MKTLKSLLLTLLVVFTVTKTNAQVGIGTTNPFAALDVFSNNNGLLIPRVALTATTDVLPVLTGTESELVYNTTDNLVTSDVSPGFYYLSAPGGPWVRLGAGATNSWLITGNTNIDGTNFLGTGASTNVDVAFKRNNLAAGRIATTSTSFGVGALNAGAATNSTAFGNNALSVSTGSNNCAFGQNALQNCNTTAQYNTAFGTNALQGISSPAAQNNVAFGFGAMGLGTGNISQCVAIGSEALRNSTAANNTAVGYRALNGSAGINTGAENTAVGTNSLLQNNTGANNTALGSGALSFNQSGSNNVAVGHLALRAGGGNSVGVGSNALISSTGTNNTAIGSNAGNTITTGSNNTVIGYGAQAFSPTSINSVTLGDGAIATLRCAAVLTTLSDRRDKTNIKKLSEGIDFIKKLKPVTFTWNTRDKLKVGVKASGFIAQDLLELQKKSSIGDNLDLVDDENPERYEARYGNLLPVMISGMQEQQALIEQLQKANAELVKANAAILKRLEKLEKK